MRGKGTVQVHGYSQVTKRVAKNTSSNNISDPQGKIMYQGKKIKSTIFLGN